MIDAARARLEAGFAARRRHDTEAAHAAIAEAAKLAPDDPQVAVAHAQIAYETWRSAATLFARARALDPANGGLALGQALALNAEGQRAEAEALLDAMLDRHPEWIEGHKALATIRTTAGDAQAFDASLVRACQQRPDDAALHLARFHLLAGARRWDTARTVLAEAVKTFGDTRGLRLARAFLASESDEASRDPAIFDAVAHIDDPGLDLARVRFHLRTGEPARAAALAEARIMGPAARLFWPYLGLAWRLTEDARAVWLQGPMTTFDPGLANLDVLEATLRNLLVLRAPYHEQSVRGGIQSDRHLFFNPDPVIQRVRARALTAVQDYIAALPPPDPTHPLLGPPRDRAIRFEGSWSVLLRGAGFHAPHTHAMGWISSALHITVPEADGQQGWLAFGAPPPELGLALEPTHAIKPEAGRLALFPSTTWHGTLPFDRGERLSIAFDVAMPM
jgi:tetratricopeptide (TPR) repeat protein